MNGGERQEKNFASFLFRNEWMQQNQVLLAF